MDDDALERLLARLADSEPARVPTTALGRLGRTAWAGLRTGTQALRGKLRGRGGGLEGLSPEAVEQLVLSLGELKGIAMKMGQMLSYIDDSLPEETRRLLSVLQIRSQPTRFAEIEATLREELGDRADALLETLDPRPVACASIGQVHRARLPDGTSVAVKVRHPGIEDAIRSDFKGARIGRTMARLMAPGADIGQIVDEARARFLEECDYALEASRQQRFGQLLDGDPDIAVPAVHPDWSSAAVLTTTWHDGMGFEAWLSSEPSEGARRRLAGALYRFYIGALYQHGLFNADPHPGNLLLDDDGRVTVLDYGCVRELDRESVRALAALSRAVLADDAPAMQSSLEALGARPVSPDPAATRALLRAFFGPVLLPGAHPMSAGVDLRFSEVIRSKRAMLRMNLPGKLLFLFRIRFGLHAVLARIGASLDWRDLESELASRA